MKTNTKRFTAKAFDETIKKIKRLKDNHEFRFELYELIDKYQAKLYNKGKKPKNG